MRSIIMMTHKIINGSLNRLWSTPLIRCHFVGLIVAALFLLMVSSAQSQTKLAFQGMWPETNGTQCFNKPKDVTVDDQGNIYVFDLGNCRIRKFTPEGRFMSTWRLSECGNDNAFIEYHPDGYIYVVDPESEKNRVQKFTLSGDLVRQLDDWWKNEDYRILRYPYGMAIDSGKNIYLAMVENQSIQALDEETETHIFSNWVYKFNSEDQLIDRWKLSEVDGWTNARIIDLAVEPDGNIITLVNTNFYDEDAPPYPEGKKAYPVHRYTPTGHLIDQWEILPSSNSDDVVSMIDGGLAGICVDPQNRIYISHIWGPWIKQFERDGLLIQTMGEIGTGEAQFNQLYNITLDKEGALYAADSDNHRIQKLTANGDFLFSIQCSGTEEGEFVEPEKITIGPDGQTVYIADSGNERIQIFENNGKFLHELKTGYVVSMAVDDVGNIYTVHDWGSDEYIKQFSSKGRFNRQFSVADGGNEIPGLKDIVYSPDHHLYIADFDNHRIIKMTTEGKIIKQWGEKGYGKGQFSQIKALAISTDGSVYVLDSSIYYPDSSVCPDEPEQCGETAQRIQKFDSDGNLLKEFWAIIGEWSGYFLEDSNDLSVDTQGNIWIADTTNLYQFSPEGEWIATLGEFGDAAGMFSGLNGITFDPNGRLYTTEKGNSRVQVFSVIDEASGNTEKENRAIIVAGGGPYQGNTLWNATQMCANMAYRTLLYQGYTRDRIHYLTWDTNLDLDGNAKLDDVDAMPSNGALKTALETWTKGADNLLVYMVDHGGDGQFRMGKDEVMSASDFSGWFSTANQNASGNTILIYDACRSGSFIPALASTADNNENPPIVITSSGDDESAYFTNNGTLSFSYQFWSQIQNGMTLRNAFFSTRNAIQFAYGNQTPLLDDNGNGIANEDDDGERSKGIAIGSGIISAGDLPTMGNVTLEPSTLNGDASATLRSENVTDADGIERVWAVISPPDFLVGNPENPVTNLPTLTLKKTENSTWEGQYTDFKATGTYKIALYAEDQHGEISLPIPLTLVQSGGDPSANISKDLFTMKIPCLQMGDGWLRPTFRMITATEASGSGIPLSGFFYELDPQNLGILSSCPSGSAELLPNFDIRISRIVYEGVAFSITMRFQGDLSNSDLYWELDLTTFTVVP